MTKPPRSPPQRPSERFLKDYSKATKAHLLEEMEKLVAKNAALERKNRRLSRGNEKLAAANQSLVKKVEEAGLNEHTGGMKLPALLLQMQPIHEAAVRHMEQPLRQGGRLPSNAGYAVLVIDLNKFKDVNDTHGHDEGNEVLRDAYKAMVSTCRKTDLVAHTGGDEFVIVLTETSRENAVGLARDVRLAIQKALIRHSVTASIGLAHFDPLMMAAKSPKEMIAQADKGVLKTTGRDQAKKAQYQNLVTLVAEDGEQIVVDPPQVGSSLRTKPKEPTAIARRPKKIAFYQRR